MTLNPGWESQYGAAYNAEFSTDYTSDPNFTNYLEYFEGERDALEDILDEVRDRAPADADLSFLPLNPADLESDLGLQNWEAYIQDGDIFGYHGIGEQYLSTIASSIGRTIAMTLIANSNEAPKVLWRIFSILISLLDTLQDSAIIEAEMVRIKSKITLKYTEKMSEVGEDIEVFSTQDTPIRQEDAGIANQKTQAKLSKLRGNREFARSEMQQWEQSAGIASDSREKQLSELMRILSQLDGIMGAIFR